MSEVNSNENRLAGIGFVFFCWHTQKYPGHPRFVEVTNHPAHEQTVCRSEFPSREALSALDVSKQP